MSKSAIALATAGGDPVITERAVITGSRLSLRSAGTTVDLIFLSSHHFKLPSPHTFPLRGPLAPRFSSFLLPTPLKGRAERREGAFNDRACEARQPRLRGVYRTDSKPVRPPLGAPPGGFGCGCRTSVVPRYCYGTVLRPPLLLRDEALGVVPHRVVSSRGRHQSLLLPRLFTVAPRGRHPRSAFRYRL